MCSQQVFRRLVAGALTACCALLPLGGRAADPFEIPVLVPVTGSAAFIGKTISLSLSLIEKSVNDSGGINGRQIKFVISDDQSNPQVALQLANGLMAKNAPVILGPIPAANCNSVGAAAAKNGPVVYCFSSAITPPPGGYMFAAHPSTHDLLAAAAKFLRERHLTKVAYITSTDATGQSDDANFDASFRGKDKGFDIVADEHFNAADISVAAQVARIKASGAQVILAWVVGTPFGTVLRNISDSGLDLPVITSGGNLSQTQMNTYAAFLPKDLYFTGFPSFAYDQLPNGPVKTAVQHFLTVLKGANVPLEIGNENAWDAGLITLDAFKRLGFNASAAQIRNYIANLHGWGGVGGMYDFRAEPQRGVGVSNVYVVRWEADRHTWVSADKLR
jgi:branched-chain amino acid transport system substrate-binding protein